MGVVLSLVGSSQYFCDTASCNIRKEYSSKFCVDFPVHLNLETNQLGLQNLAVKFPVHCILQANRMLGGGKFVVDSVQAGDGQ